MRGPIDFMIVGFDSTDFDGSILRALETASRDNTIKVLAISVIAKDKNGVITEMDMTDLPDKAAMRFTTRYEVDNYMVDQDDIDEVGELMENDTAAGLLVIEHLWAKPLKKAILMRKGYLIAEGRIHPDAAAELEE